MGNSPVSSERGVSYLLYKACVLVDQLIFISLKGFYALLKSAFQHCSTYTISAKLGWGYRDQAEAAERSVHSSALLSIKIGLWKTMYYFISGVTTNGWPSVKK